MYANADQILDIMVSALGRGVAWGVMIAISIKIVFYAVSELLHMIPRK